MIVIEDRGKKEVVAIDLGDIDEGIVFSGDIQCYPNDIHGPWFRSRFAVVSLSQPWLAWLLPGANKVAVYNYQPRKAKLILE